MYGYSLESGDAGMKEEEDTAGKTKENNSYSEHRTLCNQRYPLKGDDACRNTDDGHEQWFATGQPRSLVVAIPAFPYHECREDCKEHQAECAAKLERRQEYAWT